MIQERAKQILQEKVNFTHFVTASEHLSSGVFPELCHVLLRPNAARQLCENQATYDQLIPIYFDNEHESFAPEECGFILIQNKNREHATTLYT